MRNISLIEIEFKDDELKVQSLLPLQPDFLQMQHPSSFSQSSTGPHERL